MTDFTLARPDDWHLHLRDGAAMADVVGHTAEVFGRAIIMPNLQPPIVRTADALAYRKRILRALPRGTSFEPLMTLYLTDDTSVEEVRMAHQSGVVRAVKLYPAGATTNSDSGVTDFGRVEAVLALMAELALPLLVHAEVTDPDVDIFDREAVFIERILAPLVEAHPQLKVILEHATTAEAIAFVEGAREGVAATITPHHLLMNRNAIFTGGVRPHHYCLPVLKSERHRCELVRAATSGNRRYFLGTDSAPHEKETKEGSCGCAGIFSAHAAVALYAEVFETAGALDKLEAFASFFGADFYGLPRNKERILLRREPWEVPASYAFGSGSLVPLRAEEMVAWRVLARPSHHKSTTRPNTP
ncbi:MAG: dihydroorotase [Thermoanaerobaculales bacterium]|nr:dihydroorotase [Thermoanaerobaculales bacterium]